MIINTNTLRKALYDYDWFIQFINDFNNYKYKNFLIQDSLKTFIILIKINIIILTAIYHMT